MNARCGFEFERKTEAKPWHPVKNTAADIRSKPSYRQASLRSSFTTKLTTGSRLLSAIKQNQLLHENETANFKIGSMFNAEEFSTDFPKPTLKKPRIHNARLTSAQAGEVFVVRCSAAEPTKSA